MTDALSNYFDISDPEALREVEAGFAEARELGLNETSLPSSGWPLLSAIHRHLFQDVYPWAGQLRTVDMSKFSMEDLMRGSMPEAGFTTQSRLPQAIESFFTWLDLDAFGRSTDEEFVKLFATAYEKLNRHHPFREGNGRTQRCFWDIVLVGSGRRIDWEAGQDQIHAVSRATDRGDFRPLEALVRVMVKPEK